MAEQAVSFVVDKLTTLLTEEVKFLRGINKEVEEIRDELRSLNSFLRDADRVMAEEENSANEGLKNLVRQAREAAYCIEDVIDEYMLLKGQQNEQNRCNVKALLRRIVLMIGNLKKRHKIGLEIQDIKAAIQKMKERNRLISSYERVGSSIDSKGRIWHDPRLKSLFIEESELVGIDIPKSQLIQTLVETSENKQRMVVSVVGMGGVGKTTLVKKVYDDQRLKSHFHCRAWIPVSQSYDIVELLQSMLKQFYKATMDVAPLDKMDVAPSDKKNGVALTEALTQALRAYLFEKRFIAVFDDVWDNEFWGEVETALLENNKSSRIVITTRTKNVAIFCKRSAHVYIHEVQPLPTELALDLFYKKAFWHDHDGKCPPLLKSLSIDIVERCEGLPLAIVAVAGLMSTKGKDKLKWQKLRDNLGMELRSNPHLTSIERILTFSYLDLPYHLKSCFLYLGMFPEDYSIECSRLIRLWIANGFVKEIQGSSLEEVAEKYLIELIHRSLVQVAKVKTDGKVKTCRVHDLLREIILVRSEELSFSPIGVETFANERANARHISICNREGVPSNQACKFQTRSVILFEALHSLSSSFFANFKLLNVLDFEGAHLHTVSKQIGNLYFLSYLSLRNTKVEAIPKSIGKLQNLETLDLRQSRVSQISIDPNEFPKLRYLLVYFFHHEIQLTIDSQRGVKVQGSVGFLKTLQKLYELDIEHASVNSIVELGSLSQLKKLGIINLKRENGIALCNALEKMTGLESLAVTSAKEESFLELQSISSPPLRLQRLRLMGRLEKLPDWIVKSEDLVRVQLNFSKLKNDFLKQLQTLPNLLELWLHDAYDGKKLHFKKGSFQNLKWLVLGELRRLNKLVIDEEALSSVEKLVIGPSPELEEVHSGVQGLRNLKAIKFIDMSKRFVSRMLPEEGPDYGKVRHVPIIRFDFTTHGTRYMSYKLGDLNLSKFLDRTSTYSGLP